MPDPEHNYPTTRRRNRRASGQQLRSAPRSPSRSLGSRAAADGREVADPRSVRTHTALPPRHRQLGNGAVVELDCSPDDPVEIIVNDRVIAHGEVVVVSGNYGVRITKIASQHQDPETEDAPRTCSASPKSLGNENVIDPASLFDRGRQSGVGIGNSAGLEPARSRASRPQRQAGKNARNRKPRDCRPKSPI